MAFKDTEAGKAYQAAYMKEYMKRPGVRERHMAAAKPSRPARRSRNAAVVLAFKAAGCAFCSEIDPVCLQAHHRDPAVKEGNPSRMIGTASVERLEAELAKCICVCANCHFKIHAHRTLAFRSDGQPYSYASPRNVGREWKNGKCAKERASASAAVASSAAPRAVA